MTPHATYRLQLRQGMTFRRAAALVPYLKDLGVGWLYLSPMARAREGSTHGYDVADPNRLDPVLGTEEDFEALVDALHGCGMGLLVDIVPNHMAASGENPWWWDVLEHGPASLSAEFFDVDWEADPGEQGRLVLPVLGRPYGEALEAGELVAARGPRGFVLRYYERELPLDPRTWAEILERAGLDALAEDARNLPPRLALDPEARKRRREEARALREAVVALPEEAVDGALRALAGTPGDPASFDALDHLLERQPWRLAFWRAGLRTLNYRRFFDISDLVALCADRRPVFDETHRTVLELVRRGAVNGLRVDHVDGLLEPRRYLRWLRAEQVPYVLVEKILVGDERLRNDWEVDGTTGYEALGALTAALVDPDGYWSLEAAHAARHPGAPSFEARLGEVKRRVIDELFAADLQSQLRDLRRLAAADRHARDVDPDELELALREVTVSLPVYRTYAHSEGMDDVDRELLDRAVAEARRRVGEDAERALDFVGRVLRMDLPSTCTEADRASCFAFVKRWQQLTGPAMAKGMEDTALYVHNRLLALNDVGSHPGMVSDPVGALHEQARQRLAHFPGSMTTLSTHDTKRSADVRARIFAISEMADTWVERVDHWTRELGAQDGDPEEIDLLLQSFVGAWPFDEAGQAAFGDRLKAYVVKAAREAKVHTSWRSPDPAHEALLVDRVDRLLAAVGSDGWGRSLLAVTRRIAFHGAINALAQTLVHLTVPGVPDVYQGNELWDFSLVDPDNRRPVDFDRAGRLLDAVRDLRAGRQETDLLERWRDGRIKLFVTRTALRARAENPELFLRGSHEPIQGTGTGRLHLIAFTRELGARAALVAVPRLTCGLVPEGRWPVGSVWEEGALRIPEGRWTDAFTDATFEGGEVELSRLFARFPLVLLLR